MKISEKIKCGLIFIFYVTLSAIIPLTIIYFIALLIVSFKIDLGFEVTGILNLVTLIVCIKYSKIFDKINSYNSSKIALKILAILLVTILLFSSCYFMTMLTEDNTGRFQLLNIVCVICILTFGIFIIGSVLNIKGEVKNEKFILDQLVEDREIKTVIKPRDVLAKYFAENPEKFEEAKRAFEEGKKNGIYNDKGERISPRNPNLN